MTATSFATTRDPRPFVKWVGGKRQLLDRLVRYIPERFGTYHEPFVGGGALFFHLRPERACLSDSNERLIRTYRGLRDDPERVIELLREYPHDKEFFLEFRTRDIDASECDAEVAAWFIYLNKTAYNGLYRVNSKNIFNVPFGDNKNPNICDADNIRACSRALQTAKLEVGDFETVLDRAKPRDFVYFDPPYVPLSVTSAFTSYTRDGFDMNDQVRLRDVALELKKRGVYVLLSNSSAPAVRELYADFELIEVRARRAVNCKVEGRGEVKELLIR